MALFPSYKTGFVAYVTFLSLLPVKIKCWWIDIFEPMCWINVYMSIINMASKRLFCLRFKEIRHFYIIIVVFSKGVLSKKK